MEVFYLNRLNELRKIKLEFENKLRLKIKIDGHKVTVEGDPLDEYEASRIFEAMNFGYKTKQAMTLKEEEMVFKKIKIRSHTKRNLKDVKSRLIGKDGKTKRVISQLGDCEIIIAESEVGIIGYVEDVANVETAIINIIKGTKQSNTYKFLEKINRRKKEEDDIYKTKIK